MTPAQQAVHDYLERHGECDQLAIMREFGWSQRTASGVLGRMLEAGTVRFRRAEPVHPGAWWDGPADWLWRLPGQAQGRRRSRPVRNFLLRGASA